MYSVDILEGRVEIYRTPGLDQSGFISLEGVEYWFIGWERLDCVVSWNIIDVLWGRYIVWYYLLFKVLNCILIHVYLGVCLFGIGGWCGWLYDVKINIYVSRVVLVFPVCRDTSVGGDLNLVSSVFCYIFVILFYMLLSFPLFISFPLLILVLLWWLSSLLMIYEGFPQYYRWGLLRGCALFPVMLQLSFPHTCFIWLLYMSLLLSMILILVILLLVVFYVFVFVLLVLYFPLDYDISVEFFLLVFFAPTRDLRSFR